VGRIKWVFGGHGLAFKVGVAEVLAELKFSKSLQDRQFANPSNPHFNPLNLLLAM